MFHMAVFTVGNAAFSFSLAIYWKHFRGWVIGNFNQSKCSRIAQSARSRSFFMTMRTEKCVLGRWTPWVTEVLSVLFLFCFLFFFFPLVVLTGKFSAALCELGAAKTTSSSLPHFQEEARWRWNWWIDGWRIVKQAKTEEAWLPEIEPLANWSQGVVPFTALPTLMVTMGTSDALHTDLPFTDVHSVCGLLQSRIDVDKNWERRPLPSPSAPRWSSLILSVRKWTVFVLTLWRREEHVGTLVSVGTWMCQQK